MNNNNPPPFSVTEFNNTLIPIKKSNSNNNNTNNNSTITVAAPASSLSSSSSSSSSTTNSETKSVNQEKETTSSTSASTPERKNTNNSTTNSKTTTPTSNTRSSTNTNNSNTNNWNNDNIKKLQSLRIPDVKAFIKEIGNANTRHPKNPIESNRDRLLYHISDEVKTFLPTLINLYLTNINTVASLKLRDNGGTELQKATAQCIWFALCYHVDRVFMHDIEDKVFRSEMANKPKITTITVKLKTENIFLHETSSNVSTIITPMIASTSIVPNIIETVESLPSIIIKEEEEEIIQAPKLTENDNIIPSQIIDIDDLIRGKEAEQEYTSSSNTNINNTSNVSNNTISITTAPITPKEVDQDKEINTLPVKNEEENTDKLSDIPVISSVSNISNTTESNTLSLTPSTTINTEEKEEIMDNPLSFLQNILQEEQELSDYNSRLFIVFQQLQNHTNTKIINYLNASLSTS